MEVRIVSWNIARKREAWNYLSKMNASVALLQEAVPPPPEMTPRVASPPDPKWQVEVRGVRPQGAAIACFDDGLGFVQLEPCPVAEAGPTDLAASHAGQFAAAELQVAPNSALVTLVSLYGVWERQQGVGIYSEATLHRAISDLTPLMQAGGPLLIAGDLNIFRGYTLKGEKYWLPRYQSVFQRLGAYGMTLIGPNPPEGRGPLEGCRCQQADCTHVRTYRHQFKPGSSPDQLDFVFANRALTTAFDLSCVALDAEEAWSSSDHCPVLTVLEER